MTDEQKQQIERMREGGFGYTKISYILGISENTVKAYCRRNNLTGTVGFARRDDKDIKYCLNCGLPLEQNSKRKEKKFCNQKCRLEWWAKHPEKKNRKAIYEFECACCHRHFEVYGNAHRKYCSHECYITDRFGGAD